MRTYIIAYDLARPQLNQRCLTEAIMGLGAAWARPLENVWYLRVEGNEKEIEARLGFLLDENDGLLVQEARGGAAMANTGLRWFRHRRSDGAETETASEAAPAGTSLAGTVVAFPGSRAAGGLEADAAAA